MKISYNWLCEILPGLEKYSPQDIADKLTMSGLEIEGIEDQAAKFKGIVVGEVLEKSKHPDADKLSVCQVSDGKTEYQVVCGAPNVQAGKKYPFATLGTVMPFGLEIKPIKLRGVESKGMLCSAKELEISGNHEGLLELSGDLPTGQSVSQALGMSDVILELNVTPNRGDALSHWGVARDLSAITGLEINFAKIVPDTVEFHSNQDKTKNADLNITLSDQKGCPRYTGSQIFGVKVAPSPAWLSSRLEALGLRSINNVVDATNYVMLLTGHPVHAFDANMVAGHHIRIVSLQQEEKFTTLDSTERQLLAGDVVIADADKNVALAGIMGGENSEVTEQTQDLILEVAFFEPSRIQKTSRRLGLQTDSSYRFSRFVNPDSIKRAHEILQDLILNLAGGEATEIQDHYPQPYQEKQIILAKKEMLRILGIDVPEKDVVRILQGLQCDVRIREESYEVKAPVGRSDLTRAVDLIEEVIRIYGMDQVPTVSPRMSLRLSQENKASFFEREIKEYFINNGFYETVHYSFGEPNLFAKVLKESSDQFLRLANPISEDLAVMRPSLLPSLLESYKKNHLNTDKGLQFFELRKIYLPQSDGTTEEKRILACLYTGNAWGRNPYALTRHADFYDGKGLLGTFFDKARIQTQNKVYENWPFHPGQSCAFYQGKIFLAACGALHPLLLQNLKIKDKLYYIELDYDAVANRYHQGRVKYEAVSKLPPVYRDLALLAPKALTHQEILRVIQKEKPKYLKYIELFDQYEGESLPQGKKSLAYSFVYQPEEGSLTDEKVNEMHFALVNKLQEKLPVELR